MIPIHEGLPCLGVKHACALKFRYQEPCSTIQNYFGQFARVSPGVNLRSLQDIVMVSDEEDDSHLQAELGSLLQQVRSMLGPSSWTQCET